MKKITYIILALALATACQKRTPDDKAEDAWDSFARNLKNAGYIKIIDPMNGVVIPPEMASVTIRWTDTSGKSNAWIVAASAGNKKVFSGILTEQLWKPERKIWDKIKELGSGRGGKIYVLGFRSDAPSDILSSAEIRFETSRDSVGAQIFFRTVPLPFIFAFNNLNMIQWRLGDISSDSIAPVVLDNIYVCGNCHSFSRDGKTLAMDVDYGNDKGSYVITDLKKETALTDDKIISWSNYKKEDRQQTYGLLSQISPDGRYVISTVKDRAIFVPKDNFYYSQLFFPVKGILAIYDRKTKQFSSLPGADDPSLCQSNPNWSPDGKYIYFTLAKAYSNKQLEQSRKTVLPTEVAAEFIERKKQFKFDIYRLPFNEGRGGKPEPVDGASNNGKSNYFARYSPDGKWIVFTQANNFMLLQADSRLYIMPASGGKPRLMNCNRSNMNSWHSWSPNSKWLVFSSKERGPYTKLYLTHIDENGNDSPPLLLENLGFDNLAVNIPEFVNIKPGEVEHIYDRFTGGENYYIVSGIKKSNAGDLNGAMADFNKAAEREPDNDQPYLNRGAIKAKLGDMNGAVEDFTKAIQLKPKEANGYFNRGTILMKKEDLKGALSDFNKAISFRPDDFNAYFNRGAVLLKMKEFKKAIMDFDKAIKFESDYGETYLFRGIARAESGQNEAACEDFEKSMSLGCAEAYPARQKYCGY